MSKKFYTLYENKNHIMCDIKNIYGGMYNEIDYKEK